MSCNTRHLFSFIKMWAISHIFIKAFSFLGSSNWFLGFAYSLHIGTIKKTHNIKFPKPNHRLCFQSDM